VEAVGNWFETFGSLTPAAAVSLWLFFFLTALIAIPRVLLILTAGATFGIKVAPIILLGATVGGIAAFLLSRYIASDWFRRHLDRRPMLRAIAQAVDDEGWRIVALVRLGAPIPNFLQGYAFGLTKIPLGPYTLATFIFGAPQIVLFTFLGSTGRSSIVGQSSIALSLLAIALTIAAIALLGRRVTQLLRPHLAANKSGNNFDSG
jgi:uncharacterized membrane protein YdjX (TVP38/TMEM64 family)